MQQVQTENRMGIMPIPQLIIRSSIPLVLSMLLSSLAIFVDSIFVSRVSEQALTALSLAAPIQLFVQAIGAGIAIGLNAALSKALGEKDDAKANRVVSAALFLAMCAYLLIALLCLIAVRPFFLWQSAGDEVVASYGISYLMIYMLCSFGQMGQWIFDRLVIATGRSSLFLITLSASSVVNLILDPILIFGMFGLPALEISGAALSLVIGQTCGAVTGYFINRKYNRDIKMIFTLRPDWSCIKEILRVGIPTFLMQAINSLLGMVVNTTLTAFSSTAVAAYGICTKIQSLVICCVNGINLGLIPIVAYNYGARKRQRIYDAIRWAIGLSLGTFAIFLLILLLFPGQVLTLFNASEQLQTLGIPAVRIMTLSFFVSSVSLVLAATFQGLGVGTYSMWLNCARQLSVMLILLAAAQSDALILIWLSFVAAEVLMLPFGYFLYRRAHKKTIANL